MIKKLQERDCEIITPKEFYLEHLRPELLMIQLEKTVKSKPFDIGSWCYTTRESPKDAKVWNKQVKPRKVDLNSLRDNRRYFITSLMDHACISRWTDMTIFTHFRHIQYYLDWCDSNGYETCLDSEEKAVSAYKSYTDMLYHRLLSIKDIEPSAASKRQRGGNITFDILFPENSINLKAKTNTIKEVKKINRAPESKNVDEFLSAIIPFTRNLGRSIRYDSFPFIINCGRHDITLLPNPNACLYSPFKKPNYRFFNYDLNQYYDENEYVELMIKSKKNSLSTKTHIKNYRATMELLARNNADKNNSWYRRAWAQKVIKGYAVIIQMLTGVNPTQLVNFEYNNALEVVSDSVNKELVQVKLRSNGKIVTHPIGGRKGLRLLKEYIEFRAWYLSGRKCQYLFFSDSDKSENPSLSIALRSNFQSRFYKQLRGRIFDHSVNNITPTQARKYKSIVLQKLGLDRAEVAVALNHTEKTNEKYYSSPSVDDMKEELGSYWNSVKSTVSQIAIYKPVEGELLDTTSVGHCNGWGSPVPIRAEIPLQPSCRSQYGCLYCEHYVCHADEEDIRKLFCLRYVLNAVRKTVTEYERSDELFRNLCIRIEVILQIIENNFPELEKKIEAIKNDVNELGILTPFWDARLSRYEEAGVVL